MPQGPDDRAAPAHATTLDTTVDNAESANGRSDSVARRERPAEQAVTAYYSGTAELMPLGAQVGPRAPAAAAAAESLSSSPTL